MERRIALAIVLIMAIGIAPSFFIERPVPNAPVTADSVAPPSAQPPAARPEAVQAAPDTAAPDSIGASAPATAEQFVTVSAPLYRYVVSTRGARLVEADLTDYRTMAAGDSGAVSLVREGDALFALALVRGRDTTDLSGWDFVPSTGALAVNGGPAPLTLTATRGELAVELTYTFHPDYLVEVAGTVRGAGADGGLLLVSLGSGFPNTEADSGQNFGAYAVVTMQDGADRTDFRGFDAGERRVLDGPFEWAAVKSKYFVASIFAYDSASSAPRLSGVTAQALDDAGDNPTAVHVRAALPVPATGTFAWHSYIGPLEYDRLTALGHDFDDVNPYGWPGFRTLVRFFAVPVRWLLVEMHERLNLVYGLVLVLFGILVRILLWPLNQKAMRANMKMQEIQPLLKAAQERYKEQPQLLQQEMFRLYKEYGVNPMSGCWPMLLPMPILFALFFVFQNAIELRGQPFLWLPDLAQPDPFYIIPVVMGLSMYALSKIGMAGMEANPQMKMMLYFMPVMMTVLFLNFASGLNLYYAVSNIASLPQQWLLARERKKRAVKQIVEVKTKEPKPKRKG